MGSIENGKQGAAVERVKPRADEKRPIRKEEPMVTFTYKFSVDVTPSNHLMAHARSMAEDDGTIDVRTALRMITRDAFASALTQPFGAPIAGDTPLTVNVN